MKLADALRIARQKPADGPEFPVYLVFGGSPLHLETFLLAELRSAMPARAVTIQTGLFGDVHGSLVEAARSGASAIAVFLEWQDLDPRLGLRRSGGWSPLNHADITAGVRASLSRLRTAISEAAQTAPTAVSIPTLPLPPVAYQPRWQAGSIDLELRAEAASFAASLPASVRLLNVDELNACSPAGERLDVKMELTAGFPYTIPHTAALARLVTRLLHPPTSKKGLVTDLDDTLWAGILGEIGPENVSWDLEHHSQVHGLYQQVLASLADTGILIGIASKNDPALVGEALQRKDLLLGAGRIFPIEAGWGSKSQAFTRVLQLWNIGASDVVFVDDSPMELAEVQSVHPEVECLLFNRKDPAAVYELLGTLRDRFGRTALSEEDTLRRESLRRAAEIEVAASEAGGKASDAFLEQLNAEIEIEFQPEPADHRAFELVNKTNQFNLNGRRYEQADWARRFTQPGNFLAVVSYRDKFGPLGKIAVAGGRLLGSTAIIDLWVMSCRAFSRRIEYRVLRTIFETLGADEAMFDFVPNPRNGPAHDFLSEISGAEPTQNLRVARDIFDRRCPRLFDRVKAEEQSPAA